MSVLPQSSHRPRRRRGDKRGAGRGFERCKRALDIAAALAGLVLAAPLLGFCALWIKCADGGPVLYHQWRVGHQGWFFRLSKLRTMRLDAEKNGPQLARARDPRILSGCAWMRKSHVDELPQLWNILRGHMSLVGPRPERPEIMEQLRRAIPRIERRLAQRPGLTGLAQVSSGYANDIDGARRKLACDLRYLRRPSIAQDLRLVLATVPKVWDHAAL